MSGLSPRKSRRTSKPSAAAANCTDMDNETATQTQDALNAPRRISEEIVLFQRIRRQSAPCARGHTQQPTRNAQRLLTTYNITEEGKKTEQPQPTPPKPSPPKPRPPTKLAPWAPQATALQSAKAPSLGASQDHAPDETPMDTTEP
ncbi:hypothetical protein QE152_g24362 [Popillia japonica]|uniref:Uncharacterized protein n=1 Tax=Popillia japonica TaxID=7064 RepID=A0AAW1KF87_POPJA